MYAIQQFAVVLLLITSSWTQHCPILSRYETTVDCTDQSLGDFPPFADYVADTYELNGNSFSRLTNKTFPNMPIKHISIVQNSYPLVVDSHALSHLADSLTTLKLRNVAFQYDRIFEPVIGLTKLNNLELGSVRHSRNLSNPFLDTATMNRLVWLKISHSGVYNVAVDVLNNKEFKRLRFLGFNNNRLRFIPEGIKQMMTLPEHLNLEVDLSYNLLDTLLPEWLPYGCTMKVLNLGFNNIRSIRLRALDNCPNLQKLILEGNAELIYLSPQLFQNNCYLKPRIEVHVQHSGIRNVEFALRSCVDRVFFWNTGVPCNCRHMSLTQCKTPSNLYGECIGRDATRMLQTEAVKYWKNHGCQYFEGDGVFNITLMRGAGEALASVKDWGDCVIDDVTTSKPKYSTPNATTSTVTPADTTITIPTAAKTTPASSVASTSTSTSTPPSVSTDKSSDKDALPSTGSTLKTSHKINDAPPGVPPVVPPESKKKNAGSVSTKNRDSDVTPRSAREDGLFPFLSMVHQMTFNKTVSKTDNWILPTDVQHQKTNSDFSIRLSGSVLLMSGLAIIIFNILLL